MKAKLCRECGAEIPENASYCPGCGMEALTGKENFDVKVASKEERTFYDQWHNSGQFQRLIALLWAGFIIDLASFLVGYFDVREYYSLGRVGNVVFELLFSGWSLWLIVAMMCRKSWARKSFILLMLLTALSAVVDGSNVFGGNLVVVVLDTLSLACGCYCAFLCFGKEVVAVFLPDSKVKGARATVNRHHCASFWFCLIALSIALGGYMFVHESSDQWTEECKAAARAGSMSAREDLIDKLTEEYSAESSDEETIEKAHDKATREVDQFIKDNKTPSHSMPINGATVKYLILGVIKGGGMVLAAIFIIVGGFISKRKRG